MGKDKKKAGKAPKIAESKGAVAPTIGPGVGDTFQAPLKSGKRDGDFPGAKKL